MENQKNQNGLQKASASQPCISSEPWKSEEKASLSLTLSRVCALQRGYGKTPTEIETLVEGFSWALKAYRVKDVIEAIGKYITLRPDIPTPADIRAIIDPIKPEWSPDWEFYKNLKQLERDGGSYALGTEERAYVSTCEKYSMDRFKNR